MTPSRIRRLLAFVLLLVPSSAFGQTSASASASASSEVRDPAGMFGAAAVRKANETLAAMERKHRVPVTIETVDSLRGEPVGDVARRMARRLGASAKGMYVLLAKQDQKIYILSSKEYPELDAVARRNPIIEAFIQELKEKNFDGALDKGIQAIDRTLATIRPRPAPVPVPAALPVPVPALPSDRPALPAPAAPAESAAPGDLVIRNQVRLTLSGARRVLAGAEAKAREKVYKMNIAVVDDGGHLIAFARMDGARPASANTALTKAVTAATFRAPTGPLPAGSTTPDVLLSLSVQNAAAASGGKITTLLGGLPIIVDGQVVGAVGVGGGTGEQDVEVGKAGIEAFLAELQAPK